MEGRIGLKGFERIITSIFASFPEYIFGKDVFWAFMDLEKAYDTIDRHGMWQMLRVYGVGRKFCTKQCRVFM